MPISCPNFRLKLCLRPKNYQNRSCLNGWAWGQFRRNILFPETVMDKMRTVPLRNSKDIYPTELELKKENNSNSSASFLDIYIYIENREFHAKSFDKQDNFESYCKDAILLLHCP